MGIGESDNPEEGGESGRGSDKLNEVHRGAFFGRFRKIGE